MKERITLVTAVLAILLVAFARCEPPRGATEPMQADEQRDLPPGDPDKFTVTPKAPPEQEPKDEQPKSYSLLPLDPKLAPQRADRELVHHYILFADLDNPHADPNMVTKPDGGQTWPMPVHPLVK